MSKSDIYDEPPPYSPVAATAQEPPDFATSSSPQILDPAFFGQALRTHLSDLPNRIRSSSTRNQTAQNTADLATISLLIPHVEYFLSAAAQKVSSPSWNRSTLLGALYLVPSSAISPAAELGDLHERCREGEFIRVVRVKSHNYFREKGGTAKSGHEKGSPEKTVSYRAPGASEAIGSLRRWDPARDEHFDSWGRFGNEAAPPHHSIRTSNAINVNYGFEDNCSHVDDRENDMDLRSEEELRSRCMIWWSDERTAKRLASYLQPASESAQSLERTKVQNTVALSLSSSNSSCRKDANIGKKKSWFGLGSSKKMGKKPVEEVEPVEEIPGIPEERVDLDFKAQELKFQQENEFGLFEIVSGWGIVASVKIRV